MPWKGVLEVSAELLAGLAPGCNSSCGLHIRIPGEMGKGQQALLQVPPVSPWWLWVGCPIPGQQLLWVTGTWLCCSRAVWGVLVPLWSQWAGTRPRISLGLPGHPPSPIPSQEHLIPSVTHHSSLSAALVPAFPHFSLENVGTWSLEHPGILAGPLWALVPPHPLLMHPPPCPPFPLAEC